MSDQIITDFGDVDLFMQADAEKIPNASHAVGDKYDETEKSRMRGLKIIKVIFFVLVALLALEAVVYKVVLPGVGLPVVRFVGMTSISEDELFHVIAPIANDSWFMFDSRLAENTLADVPGIAYASVTKHFPNKVNISIIEREPVAMTFVNLSGRSVPVEIDKNGILFERREAMSDSIPIVSGIPVEHLTSGMRVPMKYKALIEQIAHIRSLPQRYFAAISEICVMPKEYGNYELVLIPAYSRTKVLTDRVLNEDALQYMMVVLDVVNSIEPNVAEIDLRYGSVSYRTR